MYTKKLKRMSALLLAMVMVFTQLPLSALADPLPPEPDPGENFNQIVERGGTTFWDETGKKVTVDPALGTNAVASVSKTITPVVRDGYKVENEFEITLAVETTVSIENLELTPDAAVVLVIDTSGSMAWHSSGASNQTFADYNVPVDPDTGNKLTPGTGEYASYYRLGSNYYGNNEGTWMRRNGSNTAYLSNTLAIPEQDKRIELAKKAAKNFLDSYVASANASDAMRMVSVVTFATNASTLVSWVDVSDAAELATVKDKIDKLSATGGTFMQGGLMLARNLFGYNQSSYFTNAEDILIDNRFVVELTDGNPTYRNNTIGTGYAAGGNSGSVVSMDCIAEDGYGGEGAVVVDNCRIPAQEVAGQIRAGSTNEYYSAKMYTVAYGTSTTKYGGLTAEEWLAGNVAFSSEYAYTARNADSLNLAFTNIMLSIKRWSEAWSVSDPMGTGIKFSSTITPNDIASGLCRLDTDAVSGVQTFVWDLKVATGTPDDAGSPTRWTYSHQYNVILNTLDSSFVAGNPVATNGKTELTYVMLENGEITSEPLTALFTVPAVQGYDGGFTILKLAYHDNQPLTSATFELTPRAGGIYRKPASISGAEGKINFIGVPSGQEYNLDETAVESPYDKTFGEGYSVKVRWGVVTVYDKLGNQMTPNPDGAYTILNKLIPGERTIYATKKWYDPDGTVHPAATIILTGVAGSNTQTYSWIIGGTATDVEGPHAFVVPVRDPETGIEFVYDSLVESPDPLSSYVTAISGSSDTGWLVENTVVAKRSVTVTKRWVIPGGTELPDEIFVTLWAQSTGSPTVVDVKPLGKDGTVIFLDVDTYDGAGQLYTFTASDNINGFNCVSTEMDASGHITLTNIMDYSEKTEISGKKHWQVGTDGLADLPDSVTVQLFADGVAVLDGESNPVVQEVDASTDWEFSFKNLPMYKVKTEGGAVTEIERIVYTVKEVGVVDGKILLKGVTYDVTYSGNNITNTRTGLRDITVTKTWVTVDSDDGLYATVQISGNGQDYSARLTKDGDGEWKHTFHGLPKYNALGEEIAYTITEVSCSPGYVVDVSFPAGDMEKGFTLQNIYADDTRVNITVYKRWQDDDDTATAAARPSITFTLYANGATTGATRTLVSNAGNQSVSFLDLPKYNYVWELISEAVYGPGEKEGDPEVLIEDEVWDWVEYPIAYTVTEDFGGTNYAKGDVVRVPETGVSGDGTVEYTFTNTRIGGQRTFTVNKTWVKPDDVAQATASFTLYRVDGTEREIETITLSSFATTASFEPVDIYDATTGRTIQYEVREAPLPNYSTSGGVSGTDENVYNFTNTWQITSRTFSGTKIWQSGSATPPSTIYVVIRGTIGFVDTEYGPYTVTPATDGTFTICELDDGKLVPVTLPNYTFAGGIFSRITYTVYECDAEGNILSEGDTFDVDGITYTVSYSGSTIYNTRNQEYTSLTITKHWVDPLGTEHPEATFTLYRRAVTVPESEWAGYQSTTWTTTDGRTGISESHTFTDLPIFNANRSVRYEYKVEETGVPVGYTLDTEHTGAGPTAFYNRINQKQITLSGEKVWVGDPVTLPGSIRLQIYADGVLFDTITVEPDPDTGKWTFAYPDPVDRYNDAGGEIVYTAKEFGESGGLVMHGESLFTVTYGLMRDDGGNVEFSVTNAYDREFYYAYEIRAWYRTVVTTINHLDGTPISTNTVDSGYVDNGRWYSGHGTQDQEVDLVVAAGMATPAETEAEAWARLMGYTGYDTATGKTGSYTFVDDPSRPTTVKLEEDNFLYVINLYFEREFTDNVYDRTPDEPGPTYDPGVSIRKELVGPSSTVTSDESVTFTYRLTVRNTGETTLSNLVVTDTMTSSASGATMTYSSDDTRYNAADNTWTIPTLRVGASTTITYSVTVDSAGTYRNVAVVRSGSTVAGSEEVVVTVTPPGGGPGDGPGDEPGEVGGEETEIGEEGPPMGNLPDGQKEEEAAPPPEEFELIDEDLPLGNLPQTGTMAEFATNGLSLIAALSMAATGRILLGRKREEEN